MSKPLIYIDQNIIGLQGIFNLSKRDDVIWIYSKEHFAEIRRSNEPEKYLGVLDAMDAKLLDLVLDENWKITGEARLIENGTPYDHYDSYIDAVFVKVVVTVFCLKQLVASSSLFQGST